jgi:hypothetical protein
MSASPALKETRVPRQVSERLSASIKRYTPAEPVAQNPAEGAAPADPPAAPPAPPANIQAEPQGDPRHADPKYWQQRFDVTSGILSREREQRVTERTTLNSQITELQTKVEHLSQLAEKAAPPAEIDLKQFFTDAQIESYGEEQCRVMAQTALKAASSEAQKMIDAAVRPLKQQRETDATTEAEKRKQAFVDKLTELVPDWQVTDQDPRWVDETTGWLAQEDEHGALRQDILNQHIRSGNAAGAAKMFKAFAKTLTVPTPPVPPSGSGAGAGEGAQPPAQGLTAPSDTDVKLFYKNSALGKVSDSQRVEFEARMKLRNPRR